MFNVRIHTSLNPQAFSRGESTVNVEVCKRMKKNSKKEKKKIIRRNHNVRNQVNLDVLTGCDVLSHQQE